MTIYSFYPIFPLVSAQGNRKQYEHANLVLEPVQVLGQEKITLNWYGCVVQTAGSALHVGLTYVDNQDRVSFNSDEWSSEAAHHSWQALWQ